MVYRMALAVFLTFVCSMLLGMTHIPFGARMAMMLPFLIVAALAFAAGEEYRSSKPR